MLISTLNYSSAIKYKIFIGFLPILKESAPIKTRENIYFFGYNVQHDKLSTDFEIKSSR